jgi:glutamate 5-kinase
MKREDFKNIKRVVIKVGTSTLSYSNGRLNFRRMETLAYVLSALRSKGCQIVLVSSGAIGVGAGRIGLVEKPKDLPTKQALAALGQAQLMKIYQKMFEGYNQTVAQVLLTKDIMFIDERHNNARGTLDKLLEMGIIPIINENDTISTDEILFGDNDTLSAMVARLVKANLLILLSDIDGLFSEDPKKNKLAHIIKTVEKITPELEQLAAGAGSSFSTGGMATKLSAAKLVSEDGIDTIITNGDEPAIVFDILEGKDIGTHFIADKQQVSH